MAGNMMDQTTMIQVTFFVPTITEGFLENLLFEMLAHRNARKRLEDATKAGAICRYRYQECVAEKGAKNSMCKAYKNDWLECKEAQYGNKLAWNKKEVHKMLDGDLIKADLKDGYTHKKDPLKTIADAYEKCVATYSAEYSKCKNYRKSWWECKAAQNRS